MIALEEYQKAKEIVEKISQELRADFYIYNSSIEEKYVDNMILEITHCKQKGENVVLILTTLGGDSGSAYRLARFLEDTYKRFILFVFGRCKSAGTLLSLAADEIVMSELGELGPLDLQIPKDEDLGWHSSLNIQQSPSVISEHAYEIYRNGVNNLLEFVRGQEHLMSLKTAEDLAMEMAIKLMQPVAAQIDPLRLTAFNRRTKIVKEYGKRLNSKLSEGKIIDHLVDNYPEHGFVIDFQEANALFENVRKPTDPELYLSRIIHDWVRPCLEGIVYNFYDFLKATSEVSQDDSLSNSNEDQEYRENGKSDNKECFSNETAVAPASQRSEHG